MQRVVIPPVLELLFDAPADFEPMLRRDRHVTGVKQLVEGGPEENAVVSGVKREVVELADVRRGSWGLVWKINLTELS